ncbi:MAG: hemerythrin domain-containing protein [Myxococcaceae bacterium]|nr:hemerythrin domain-containing protein [Myxococcaceae bacterium]
MLIDTFKQQHQELVQLIGRMDAALACGGEAETRAVLSRLAQAIRVHLSLEDQIYPGLIRVADAKQDLGMLETARLFASNMQRITALLQDFLSKHQARFDLEQFRSSPRALVVMPSPLSSAPSDHLSPPFQPPYLLT